MNEEELREEIEAIIKKPMRSEISTSDIAVGMWSSTCLDEKVSDLAALIRTEVLKAEKAYGGCHSCYGKGYATANEFASGRGVKWRISNMRFCSCDRGRQLKEVLELNVQLQTNRKEEV